jgi:hypothetical protein
LRHPELLVTSACVNSEQPSLIELSSSCLVKSYLCVVCPSINSRRTILVIIPKRDSIGLEEVHDIHQAARPGYAGRLITIMVS